MTTKTCFFVVSSFLATLGRDQQAERANNRMLLKLRHHLARASPAQGQDSASDLPRRAQDSENPQLADHRLGAQHLREPDDEEAGKVQTAKSESCLSTTLYLVKLMDFADQKMA